MHDGYVHLFWWLPIHDLLSARQVSQEWNALSGHDYVWSGCVREIFLQMGLCAPKKEIRDWFITQGKTQALTRKNLARGHCIVSSLVFQTNIRCAPLLFERKGSLLIAYGKGKHLWISALDGKKMHSKPLPQFSNPSSLVTFHYKGKQYLGIGSLCGKILLWNFDTRHIRRLIQVPFPIIDLRYQSAGGGRLVWLGRATHAYVLSISTKENRRPHILTPGLGRPCLAALPANKEGSVLLAAGSQIQMWRSPKDAQSISFPNKHDFPISHLALAPRANFLVSADLNGKIWTWNIATQKALDHFEPKCGSVECLTAWELGPHIYFAMGTHKGHFHIWQGHAQKSKSMTPLYWSELPAPLVAISPCSIQSRFYLLFHFKHSIKALGTLKGLELSRYGEIILQDWNQRTRSEKAKRKISYTLHRLDPRNIKKPHRNP